MTDLEKRALEVAYSLGINVYVREDGSLAQNGPGHEVKAPKSATPTLCHGAEQVPTAPPPAG